MLMTCSGGRYSCIPVFFVFTLRQDKLNEELSPNAQVLVDVMPDILMCQVLCLNHLIVGIY